MKLQTVDIEGKEKGSIELSLEIEGKSQESLSHVVYLVNKYQHASLRQGSANTKSRGEVSGGGAKPYRQKGTGNARRGTNRTPLRVGGSVIFGPKPRDFSISLNGKVIKQGIKTALSTKAESTKVLTYKTDESLKSKQIVKLLKGLSIPSSEKVLFIIGQDEENLFKAARNLGQVTVADASFIPVSSVMHTDHVIVSEQGSQFLQEWFTK